MLPWATASSQRMVEKAIRLAQKHALLDVPLSTHHRFENLQGWRFDRLFVISYAGAKAWQCICDCGTVKRVAASKLKEGTRSCGCFGKDYLASIRKDYVNTPTYKEFHKIKHLIKRWGTTPGSIYYGTSLCAAWAAKNGFEVFLAQLGEKPTPKHGLRFNRGVRQLDVTTCFWATVADFGHGGIKHGLTGSGTYTSYRAMIERCYNKKSKAYSAYGGNGVKVCDRWRFGEQGFSGFECFIADMGHRPSSAPTIDRIKNTKHYEPNNCRWATRRTQRINQQTRVNLVTCAGKTQCLNDWSLELGIPWSTLKQRLDNGLTPAQAFRRLR